MAILRWLAFSVRELSLDAIAEASVARPHVHPFDPEDRLLHATEVLRICNSLVTITTETNTTFVRFAHFSVQEYLLSDRSGPYSLQADSSHAYIAGSCISYLHFVEQDCNPKDEVDDSSYPLFNYAARCWPTHVSRADGRHDQDLLDQIYGLFHPDFTNRSILWLRRRHHQWNPPPDPLAYAAFFGLTDTTQRLLESGAAINELHDTKKDRWLSVNGLDRWCTALEIAVARGRLNIVKLLLSYGADCNAKTQAGSILRRAMETAKHNGHERTTQVALVLLENGADPKPDCDGLPSMSIAAIYGLCDVIQAIVQYDRRPYALTMALKYAIRFSQEPSVRLLLDLGADANDDKVIREVAVQAHKAIRDCLIRQHLLAGVKLSPIQSLTHGAFHAFVLKFEECIAQYNRFGPELLPKVVENIFLKVSAITLGVDFSKVAEILFRLSKERYDSELISNQAKDRFLIRAAEWRRPELINQVLQAGASPHMPAIASDRVLITLLQAAIRCAGISRLSGTFDDVFKTLLPYGVDVNQHPDGTDKPLFMALIRGEPKVAIALLEAGANVTGVITSGGKVLPPGATPPFEPLQLAATMDDICLLELLLSRGVDVTNGKPSPIECAAYRGCESSIRFLLDRGAIVQSQILLSLSRHTTVAAVGLLVSAGADINASDDDGNTPLIIAWDYGNFDVMLWLLDHGADFDLFYRKDRVNDAAQM